MIIKSILPEEFIHIEINIYLLPCSLSVERIKINIVLFFLFRAKAISYITISLICNGSLIKKFTKLFAKTQWTDLIHRHGHYWNCLWWISLKILCLNLKLANKISERSLHRIWIYKIKSETYEYIVSHTTG